MTNIMSAIKNELDLRLCCVQLIDCHYCSDPGTFNYNLCESIIKSIIIDNCQNILILISSYILTSCISIDENDNKLYLHLIKKKKNYIYF